MLYYKEYHYYFQAEISKRTMQFGFNLWLRSSKEKDINFFLFLLNNPSFIRVVSAGTTCHHQIQVWRTVWYHRASKRTVTRLPETLWRPKAQYHQRWYRINQRAAKFLICTLTNFYGFARRKTSAFDSQRTQKIESSN